MHEEKKYWVQPLLFEVAFKSDGKFVTRHFRNECRVRLESRLHTEVIQRNETAKDRCSNAAFERHRGLSYIMKKVATNTNSEVFDSDKQQRKFKKNEN